MKIELNKNVFNSFFLSRNEDYMKNITFKLVNYCIQYYLHNNYSFIYLTDEQWIQLIIDDIYRKKFFANAYKPIKIGKSTLSVTENNYLSSLLLVSLNYNITRFKYILCRINKYIYCYFYLNNLLFIELILQLLKTYKYNNYDYIPLKNIKFSIINDKYYRACLYELFFLLSDKDVLLDLQFNKEVFIKALLQHYIRIDYKYFTGSNFNISDDFGINNLKLKLFHKALEAGNINDKLLLHYTRLIQYLHINTSPYINVIYEYIYKNYIKTNDINVLYMIKILYNALDFNKQQKNIIEKYINTINAKMLLFNI